MNKKSQSQILKEVFQFGLGVLFLSFIFIFLYDILMPSISDYSLQLHAKNIAQHTNFLISLIYQSNYNSFSSNSINTYPMPETIGDNSYLIYIQDNNICCSMTEKIINECIPLLIDAEYFGIYFSGGDLKITINYNETDSIITLSN